MNQLKYPMQAYQLKGFNRKTFFLWSLKTVALVLLLSLQLPLRANIPDTTIYAQANTVVELTFISARKYPDPDNQLTIDAVIMDPNGREHRVPGFWEVDNKWIVRYSSEIIGTHRFRSECSETDKGLNGVIGKIIVRPSQRKKLSN